MFPRPPLADNAFRRVPVPGAGTDPYLERIALNLFSLSRRLTLSAALGVLMLSAALAHAAATNPAAATADFYQQVGKANLSGVAAYVPADGFSELSAESADLHQLGIKDFENVFKAGVKLDFSVSDIQVRELGSSAIVTGYRVGQITPPGGQPIASRQRITLVWGKNASGWQLYHVHLSNLPAAAAP